MKKATPDIGRCKDCFFWEDGRGGVRRPLTTAKRKTCFEKGMSGEDRCDHFIPINMHPVCGTCRWLDTEWHGKSCRDRYSADEHTTANHYCKDKYELLESYDEAVTKDLHAPVYHNGRPVQVIDVDIVAGQDILIRMGNTGILSVGADIRKIKLENKLPVVTQHNGAYVFEPQESREITQEPVKISREPSEPKEHSGEVVGEVAPPDKQIEIPEQILDNMEGYVSAMEKRNISKKRAITRAVKIEARKYNWNKRIKDQAEEILKERIT